MSESDGGESGRCVGESDGVRESDGGGLARRYERIGWWCESGGSE